MKLFNYRTDISTAPFLHLRYERTDCALMCTADVGNRSHPSSQHGDFLGTFTQRLATLQAYAQYSWPLSLSETNNWIRVCLFVGMRLQFRLGEYWNILGQAGTRIAALSWSRLACLCSLVLFCLMFCWQMRFWSLAACPVLQEVWLQPLVLLLLRYPFLMSFLPSFFKKSGFNRLSCCFFTIQYCVACRHRG